jgi:hypothetical protein
MQLERVAPERFIAEGVEAEGRPSIRQRLRRRGDHIIAAAESAATARDAGEAPRAAQVARAQRARLVAVARRASPNAPRPSAPNTASDLPQPKLFHLLIWFSRPPLSVPRAA